MTAQQPSINIINPAMRIGVLLCDHIRQHLQPIFGDYPAFFIRQLKRVAPTSEIVIYDITKTSFPQSMTECDVYMISGSKKSCYENIHWIVQLQEFIRQCHAKKHPLVGICFGHQIMALALGGEVSKSSKGWGMGVHSYIIDEKQYIFDKSILRVLVSHQDQVITPATNSQTIGGSDFSPHSVIVYGQHGISMQGHPELTEEYSRTILGIRRNCVGEQVYQQALRNYAKATDADHITHCLLNYHRFATQT